jgi:hypothetical protein
MKRRMVGLVLMGLVLAGCSSPPADAVNEDPSIAMPVTGQVPQITPTPSATVATSPVPVPTVSEVAPPPPVVVNEPVQPVQPAVPAPVPKPVPKPTTPPRPTTPPVNEADFDWTGDTPPEPDSLPLCQHADSESCYYPGLALGDKCDWVNSPDLVTTWFFNCTDPSLNGKVQ